jgi:two-component system, chemotaxis family, sensor kinase CheA
VSLTLEHCFELEAAERLSRLEALTSESNLPGVRLELHRWRSAARSIENDALEQVLAVLELGLKDGRLEFQDAAKVNNAVCVQVLEVLGLLEPLPLELEHQFNLELMDRGAQIVALLQQENIPAVQLELQRLRSAARSLAHPLEPLLQQLEAAKTSAAFFVMLEQFADDANSSALKLAFQQVPESTFSSTVSTLISSPVIAEQPVARAATPKETIRVDVPKLDALLSQVGELTVGRIRLEERLRALRNLRAEVAPINARVPVSTRGQGGSNRDASQTELIHNLDAIIKALSDDLKQLRMVNDELEHEVLSVRLQPGSSLVAPLERGLRDLCAKLGKEAKFEATGGEVELDRRSLEGLRDPLMHMLRNSLDHGLESPAEREQIGKPRQGRVRLEVRSLGAFIEVVLSDDGAGIKLERVRNRAVQLGWLTADAKLSPEDGFEMLFQPGFSTAEKVSETSGRGVGLDVVRENVRALGGSVRLESTPGIGTRFVVRLPVTLATTRVLLARVADSTLALPINAIVRTGRTQCDALVSLEGHRNVSFEGRMTRLLELGAILELPVQNSTQNPWLTFVVIGEGRDRLALVVDELIGAREVVLKRLGWPLAGLPQFAGAAVLDSGVLVPILNLEVIRDQAASRRVRFKAAESPAKARSSARILVVDDSITTRTLERSILEAAGFETLAAENGRIALEVLRRETVDLVLSDVEMPELDGFGLISAIRRDAKLQHLPTILVTSLGAEEHKSRGAAAGADAYIVKGEFDQGMLLETIGRLL